MGLLGVGMLLGTAIWAYRSKGISLERYGLPVLVVAIGLVVTLIASGDLLMDLLMIWVASFLVAVVAAIDVFGSMSSIMAGVFNWDASADRSVDAEPESVLSMTVQAVGRYGRSKRIRRTGST
jgi:hypothetical protein